MRVATVVLIVLLAVTGCDLIRPIRPPPPPTPTPFPTLPAEIPADMAAAIDAARPLAAELSRGPSELDTAFQVDLKTWCPVEIPECAEANGPGWAVVFDITAPDGAPGSVTVILDAAYNVRLTQQ